MYVISAAFALFVATGAYKYSDMCLVRSLVGRESRVAIDAVCAVGRSKTRGFRLDCGNSIDQLLCEFLRSLLYFQIAVFVGIELFAVVVCLQFFQKCK